MRAYVQVSGIVFTLVALGHLLRMVARWPLLLAGRPLPGVVSLIVFLVAGGMSLWAWRILANPRDAA